MRSKQGAVESGIHTQDTASARPWLGFPAAERVGTLPGSELSRAYQGGMGKSKVAVIIDPGSATYLLCDLAQMSNLSVFVFCHEQSGSSHRYLHHRFVVRAEQVNPRY